VSVPGLRLRVAGEADLNGVVALERRVVEAPHWAEGEYGAIVGEGGEGAVRRCLFVAETDEKLLGFAVGKVILSAANRVGEIESVAVDGPGRRRGVGRSLCEAVLLWCRDQGAVEMELEVRAGSGGAIALYAGLGFDVVGRRGGYYREPDEDAVLMQLKLAEAK
jgi:ribosomal-protein-alanine N-acetyltransferase